MQATLARWQIVFYIAAAVYLIDTIIYIFFASCEEQPWNREVVVSRLQSRSTDNLLPIPEDCPPQAVTSDEEGFDDQTNNDRDIVRV